MKNFEMAIVCNLFPAPINVARPMYPASPYRAWACKDLAVPNIIVVTDVKEKYKMGGKDLYNHWGADAVAADIAQEAGRIIFGARPADGAMPGIWVSDGAELVTNENERKLGPGVIVVGKHRVGEYGVVKEVAGRYWIPQSEIDFHRKRQDKMGENIIAVMDVLQRSDKEIAHQTVENMRPVANIFARWFKIEGREWQEKNNSEKSVACPECQQTVPAKALKCSHCGGIVNTQAYAEYKRKQNEFLASFNGEDDDTKAVGSRKKAKEPEPVTA